MTAKSSPGPWRAEPNPTDQCVDVFDARGEFVCDVGLGTDEQDMARADSRLVAAAPEMFALLVNIFAFSHVSIPTRAAIKALLARIDGDAP